MWHARCAVLSLLGIYLHASPDVQRLAVQKWNVVPVLISLLWEQPIQKLVLDMVRPSDAQVHNDMCLMLILVGSTVEAGAISKLNKPINCNAIKTDWL